MPSARTMPGKPRTLYWVLNGLLVVCAFGCGWLARHSGILPIGSDSHLSAPRTSNQEPHNAGDRQLSDLLTCSESDLEKMDPLEIDLAVARSIDTCRDIQVSTYATRMDEWAAKIRSETDRHLYKFQQASGEYKNSLGFFKALVMVTVVGQDFGVTYDTQAVAFSDPEDLFVHGVIDRRRGTCVSLPVLYMALGYRLGYPIKVVAVPKHLFCRWEDSKTGERFNIEAANAGGLTDYPDEHYRSWPSKLDDRDVQTGGALKTLTMREFLGCKLASRGDYYWHEGVKPEAQTSYVLAHQLYPASRSIYEILVSQVADEAQRYDWSPVLKWTRMANPDPGLQAWRGVLKQRSK